MKLLYLTVDLLTVAVPLLFSFHPKIRFHKTWKALFTAILSTALPFLIMDSLFTAHGVWSFNPAYITGICLFNLPIEEVVFFICIPYACLFTFYCLDKFYSLSWNPTAEIIFCILFSVALLVTGWIFRQRIYTSSTFISTAVLCLLLKFAFHTNWFGKAVSVYAILIFPFLLVNGILTGSEIAAPVVSYNPLYHLGIRVMTIPVEDFIYGFELYLLNLALYLLLDKLIPSGNTSNRPTAIESENINLNGKYKGG